MSRRTKPVVDKPKDERLPLTKRQAASVANSQAALQVSRDAANAVFRAILDAAGIDDAEIAGGNVDPKDPHLMLRRKP